MLFTWFLLCSLLAPLELLLKIKESIIETFQMPLHLSFKPFCSLEDAFNLKWLSSNFMSLACVAYFSLWFIECLLKQCQKFVELLMPSFAVMFPFSFVSFNCSFLICMLCIWFFFSHQGNG